MLQSFLQFLQFLPAGLLVATACLEGFVLSRRDRDCEPAVLWLLFCTALTAAISAVLSLTLYLVRIESGGLTSSLTAGAIAAAASVAWWFKRQARNRSFLLLRERFYDPANANQPPQRKPWQAFLIIGYRSTLAAAVLGAMAAPLFHGVGGWPTAGVASPLAAETAGPAPAPVLTAVEPAAMAPAASTASTAGPPAADAPLIVDPTRSEIPDAEVSAMAAMAAPVAVDPAAAPAAADPAAEPSPAAMPVVAVAPAPPARPVSKNSLYFSKIRPLFAKHCVSCHGATKQKGDLRLDTPDFIRAGVNGKPIIVPGVPAKSRAYHVTTLPQDDIDRMPPKGTPLNANERALLAEWITNGADLGDGVSIPSGHDGVFLVDTIAANLAPPDPQIIEDLKKDHVVIRELSKNGFVLELDFSHSDRARADLKLAQLAPLALNIYALDFSRTNISDADLAQLAPMKNLSRLLLSRTGITDAGLPALQNNPSLEHLNLYNTMVSDSGLASLAGLTSLKKVYLWQSKATADGAKQLQERVPGLVVSIGD